METQTTGVATGNAVAGVEAELIFTRANRAPEVILAFNGLGVPKELFGELHGIGWSIPSMPPPPGTAIEWTPDPQTGEDYTIKPWRVHEFKLQPASWWTPETEKTIGASTIEALKRHGATISGLRGGQDTASAPVPGAPTAAMPVAPAPVPEATAPAPTPAAPTTAAPAPAAAGRIIIVLEKDAGPAIDAMTSYESISSRKRESWTWSEGTQTDPTILNELANRSASIWVLDPDNRPTATTGSTTLHFLAMGKDAGAAQTKKLQAILGAASSTHPLQKVNGEEAVLVCAVVPTNAEEMLLSNVRLRFPKLICRSAAG